MGEAAGVLAQKLGSPLSPACTPGLRPCHSPPRPRLPWLQAVGGVLFPMAVLWVWEERLRARELRGWRRLLHQQQLEADRQQQQLEADRQQQQLEADRQQQAGSSQQQQQQQAGSSQQPGQRQQQGGGRVERPAPREGSPPPEPGDLPRPAGWAAAWFVASSWLVWQLLEAVLL